MELYMLPLMWVIGNCRQLAILEERDVLVFYVCKNTSEGDCCWRIAGEGILILEAGWVV